MKTRKRPGSDDSTDLRKPAEKRAGVARAKHPKKPSAMERRRLAVSTYSDSRYVRAMMAAGASGYVLKCYAHEELLGAIRAVAAGKTYLSLCLEVAAAAASSPGTMAP